jgi:hypothetical protein
MTAVRLVLIGVSVYLLTWFILYSANINVTYQSEDTVPTMFIPVTLLKNTLYVTVTIVMVDPILNQMIKSSLAIPILFKK